MPEQRPSTDLYKLLQVDSEADAEIIQAAYRRLAQRYHPDVATDAAAAQRMKALNAAWEVLRDPIRRAEYDRLRERSDASRQTSAGVGERPRAASPGERPRTASPGERPRTASTDATAASSTFDPWAEAAQAGTTRPSGGQPTGGQPRPQAVSRDWTTGRSTMGGGYDPATMRAPDGHGAAGPPPGAASGSVLNFGRYAGWSLGEIGRTDIEYLEWLDRMPIGRQYADEIDGILRRRGIRRPATAESERRGLFRRR